MTFYEIIKHIRLIQGECMSIYSNIITDDYNMYYLVLYEIYKFLFRGDIILSS